MLMGWRRWWSYKCTFILIFNFVGLYFSHLAKRCAFISWSSSVVHGLYDSVVMNSFDSISGKIILLLDVVFDTGLFELFFWRPAVLDRTLNEEVRREERERLSLEEGSVVLFSTTEYPTILPCDA